MRRQPPRGYIVADEERWNACSPMMTEANIRERAEGGLERIGLKLERKHLEENGQVSMAEMFGELDGDW